MEVVNIVVTATLDKLLDLSLIHNRIKKHRIPFDWKMVKDAPSSGEFLYCLLQIRKILITSKDPEELPKLAERVVNTLKDIGIKVKINRLAIHNIVISHTIRLNCSLENLIVNLDPKKASYEPEQFPGLIYRDWGLSFLLFSSGKVIVAGLKEIKDAESAIIRFEKVIDITSSSIG
jgi:transcription initiation factor TFIID TATA-box-binding protein